MAKLTKGALFISPEIRAKFASFYLFGDMSTTKKDLIGGNDLSYETGSPELFYGRDGVGESFDGSKYLVNRSISPTLNGFPFFLFVHFEDRSDGVNDLELITISPWISDYAKRVHIAKYFGADRVGGEINEDASSYSNTSKKSDSNTYSAAFVVRSISNFICYVNGERLTQFQTNATTFLTPKNCVAIGAATNGNFKHVGGIYSAGWGTIDPGDDFLKRISSDPSRVIFQSGGFNSSMRASGMSGARFRKSLSTVGGRVGKRQSY